MKLQLWLTTIQIFFFFFFFFFFYSFTSCKHVHKQKSQRSPYAKLCVHAVFIEYVGAVQVKCTFLLTIKRIGNHIAMKVSFLSVSVYKPRFQVTSVQKNKHQICFEQIKSINFMPSSVHFFAKQNFQNVQFIIEH